MLIGFSKSIRWGAGFVAFALGALAVQTFLDRPNRVDSLGNSEFVEQDGVLFYRDKPFSGVQVERYPDGKIYRETPFRMGMREGIAKEYATTGSLRVKWNYHDGKKDGLQEGWFIEGPKRFEEHYKVGLLNGLQTQWHINGTIFNQQVYVDGVEASRKILYPTSEVYSNYVKRNGRTYGVDGGALCFEVKKDGEI